MIKLFLTDVDSTLTDGIYQIDEAGRIRKNFYTRDFHGMWRLSQTGVTIGIITNATDQVIVHQCRRAAEYVTVMNGTKDKLATIRGTFVLGEPLLEWDEICYVGDDVSDIELMIQVGLAACPSDADREVMDLVLDHSHGFVSSFPGGKGCVREFADYVFDLNEGRKNGSYR